MRRTANGILLKDDHILMIKKPRRGWYAMPGGKMELGESVKEAVTREFREETGLELADPELTGVYTYIILDGEQVEMEWMMFAFSAHDYTKDLVSHSEEGELEWIPISEVLDKPMADGDRLILEHAIHRDGIMYGTFYYTPDYSLLSYRLDPSIP
ncbi:8-oxo-dGTP diphosphatase [Radiobacillus kanasensis]|uniref:8-oxo-dGTP diphosphatase n=1 Tax=Radiobacillus kanasensis TaxID=2844358 RepID=UPI001E40F110|nr:8-oxo-dGTP diphosphatase [Radiobacillus kanasensis]UFT98501.1 8-oxo-dGTP diphosphatase [Radiobacillus kanasensis]